MAPPWVGTTEGGAREVLGFIDGRAAHYPLAELVRSEEALANVARAVRAMHDATGGFVPDEPDRWLRREARVPARIDCIGHHDLAPWNIIFDGTEVAGIIDWDCDERHAEGYREDVQYILTHRDVLLG